MHTNFDAWRARKLQRAPSAAKLGRVSQCATLTAGALLGAMLGAIAAAGIPVCSYLQNQHRLRRPLGFRLPQAGQGPSKRHRLSWSDHVDVAGGAGGAEAVASAPGAGSVLRE